MSQPPDKDSETKLTQGYGIGSGFLYQLTTGTVTSSPTSGYLNVVGDGLTLGLHADREHGQSESLQLQCGEERLVTAARGVGNGAELRLRILDRGEDGVSIIEEDVDPDRGAGARNARHVAERAAHGVQRAVTVDVSGRGGSRGRREGLIPT